MRAVGKNAVPSLQACGLACLLSLLVLAFTGLAQADRGLWQDEATLLANMGQPLPAYFQSLPLYDQAAPPMALLILNGLYLLAGESVSAMRLLLLGLSLALFASVALTAWRRRDREVLLALAALAVTPLVVRYAVEPKQYIFELHASLLFMVALRWFPHRPGAIMALAGLLSFASFSIMLVVGVATLEAILFRFRGTERRHWLTLLAVYTITWIACYLLLFRPAVALQTLNYPDAYQRLPFGDYIRNPLLLRPHLEEVVRAQVAIVAAGTLAGVAAMRLAGQRAAQPSRALSQANGWQPLRVFAALFALVAILWVARIYPVASKKQFLFTMPLGALAVAHCVTAACARMTVRAGTVVLAAMFVPSALVAIARERNDQSDFQDTRGLYAYLRANRQALILPDLLFEPTLRHYVGHDPAPPRRISGWLDPRSAPMESPREVVARLAAANTPIRQHAWVPIDNPEHYPAYARWLLRDVSGEPDVIVAVAQPSAHQGPIIAAEAKRKGCSARPGYASRQVVAFRFDCSARR